MTTDIAPTATTDLEPLEDDVDQAEALDAAPTEEELAEAKRRREAHNVETNNRLKFFGRTVNQGEWLRICRLLDYSREQISEDQNLTLLALAWVKDKRERGGGDVDVLDHLLTFTDEQLLEFHGFEVDPADADEQA